MTIDKNPTTFTSDWFSGNIPQWNKYKPFFDGKENKKCLEIGSYEGRSTIFIINNFCNGKNSHLDALDTWEGSIEHSQKDKDGLYDRFKNNLAPYINKNQVTLYRDFSINTLMKFVQEVKASSREKYDFIYIDGSHTAQDVLMDALLSWELLKTNGIMIFDDYKWHFNNIASLEPKVAIDGFLNSFEGMYTTLLKDYQVHIQKTADFIEY
jgi:predicted O-methyltransferase YrrM